MKNLIFKPKLKNKYKKLALCLFYWYSKIFSFGPRGKSFEEILSNLFWRCEADLHWRSSEKWDLRKIFSEDLHEISVSMRNVLIFFGRSQEEEKILRSQEDFYFKRSHEKLLLFSSLVIFFTKSSWDLSEKINKFLFELRSHEELH